ncbi:hypothetical protein [uncultured Pseudoteredinibacter sp.]|uniref:hypothetical protein n=1 Tax=uncultured Pseudoteredinibacter sp. TaxID=1641701 RepID=UPI0026391294|nr:hypothetical protein [uncultured Pseudoteredinibacter sp.]
MPKKANLKFSDIHIVGKSVFGFKKSQGRVVFEASDLGNSTWDYSSISQDDYDCLKILVDGKIQHKQTSENYEALRDIANKNGDVKEKLELEYLVKRERLLDFKNQAKKSCLKYKLVLWLFKWILQQIFAYFCKWTRFLYSVPLVIFMFALVYSFNFDKIIFDEKISGGYLYALSSSIYFSIVTLSLGV